MTNLTDNIKNSFSKNKKGIALMLCSSVCVCAGQLLWKLAGADKINILLLIGGFCVYGLGALIMVIAYRYGSLSVLQPTLAASYVFAPIIGKIFLDESISPLRILGIAVIIAGILLIGGGDE